MPPPENIQVDLRVVGVDDWAFRRGSRYGTILVDLEKHKVIELLPDATAETLKQWLNQQPQIEVISRDRASAYDKAAREAAPQAQQVADRFHLSQSLWATTERMIKRIYEQMRRAFQTEVPGTTQATSLTETEVALPPGQAPSRIEGSAELTTLESGKELSRFEKEHYLNAKNKLELYAKIRELAEAGVKYNKIAERLNISSRTVSRYLNGSFSVGRRHDSRKTKLDPYKPYLLRRMIEEHYDNAKGLQREIEAQGYSGGYSAVSLFLAQVRVEQGTIELTGKPITKQLHPLDMVSKTWLANKNSTSGTSPAKKILPGIVKTTWLLFLPVERLRPGERELLSLLRETNPTIAQAYPLIQSLGQMVRERDGRGLSEWLTKVEQSEIAELKSLAKGIRRDEAAVRVGLALRWNQGLVEGKINKLKLIKRKLYGKANFDLLRAMVLAAETEVH